MKIGVGKSIIHISKDMLPLEKFISIHDDLHVRVLWIEEEEDYILVSLEMTSLQNYAIEKMKDMIYARTNVLKEHIIICVTHSFSSPHTRSLTAMEKMDNDELKRTKNYMSSIETALLEAVNQAEKKTEALVGFQNGYCSINVNRDMYTDQGWWLGANDLGASDKSVGVIRFDDVHHHPICILYNYDVQSSIMDKASIDNGYQITSDLVGHCSTYIEENMNCLAFYMLGAAGDQAPLFKACHNLLDKNNQLINENIGKDGYVFVNSFGKKLGDAVISTAKKINTDVMKKISYHSYSHQYDGQKILDIKNITPKKEYQYVRDEERQEIIEFLILGEIAIVMVKPELSSQTGMAIKNKSPFHHTLVATMINGAAKYMPDQSAYDRNTYEAMNSMFYRGSAEQLENHVIHDLNVIKGETNENRNK